jgi:outer membrane receptor protein involved in Fe transport
MQQSVGIPSVISHGLTSLRRATSVAVLASFLGATPGNVALAQESELVLEEIMVTARKREERMLDVPIAITAVSGESIRALNIENLEWLSQQVPNFSVREDTGTDSLSVRGIRSGVNFGFEQTVGQVWDGFFYGRSRLTRIPFLDVERVEILKGPQGALIGKNTTAGVINITSARPTEMFEAWGTVSYETFDDAGDGVTVEGAVSGPIGDALQGRLAARHKNGGGWIENIATGQDVPDSDDTMFRGILSWQAADNLDFTLQWTHSDQEREGQSKQLAFCSTAMVAFLESKGLPTVSCGEPNKVTMNAAPRFGEGNHEVFETEADLAGLTINWELGGGHMLTSLTGFAQYETLDLSEGDRTPLEILNTRLAEDYEQWSQEIRLTSPSGQRFEYIAGVLYQDIDLQTLFGLDINLGPRFAPAPAPPPFSRNVETNETSETWSVFGQFTWHFNEQWLATVDGRFTDEEKAADQISFQGAIYDPTGPIGNPFHVVAQSRDENDFSPGVALQFRPSQEVNVYGSWRRGFKGGGFDHQSFDPQPLAERSFQFDEEEVEAYELGAKMLLLDHTMQLNVAVFKSDFDDLQAANIDNTSGVAITRIANAAKATTEGFELDVTWMPVDNLRLYGAVGYNDAKHDEFPGGQCYRGQTPALGCDPGPDGVPGGTDDTQDLSGTRIPNAPEWSGVANGEYRWVLPGGLSLAAFVQAVYSDWYFTTPQLDPVTLQDDYWKFDARLTLADASNRWSVALVGRNLTDETTIAWGNTLPGFMPPAYHPWVDPGRSYILQASLRY